MPQILEPVKGFSLFNPYKIVHLMLRVYVLFQGNMILFTEEYLEPGDRSTYCICLAGKLIIKHIIEEEHII